MTFETLPACGNEAGELALKSEVANSDESTSPAEYAAVKVMPISFVAVAPKT
jgi:hypothetical protein